MLKKSLQTIGKKIISIIMIIIIIYTVINSIIVNVSYAVTQTRNTDSNNIYSINESLYPGYASLLQSLKSTHPNWTFTLFYTDLDWAEVLMNETVANHARSLVQGKTGEWLCTDAGCVNTPHDGSSWFGASQTAVAYYMDPRNFLTEDKVFQFEALSYVPSIHTEAGVEAVLAGSFMYNKKISEYYNNKDYGDKTFAQAIMSAAQASGASPYHIASRIKQEIGVNGSGSSSGKVSGYEGYFNFFNIGAYAGTDAVKNALIYAQNNNWNTPEIAITEGAKWIAKNYISVGQDTLYLQKWDVAAQDGMYGHQYMQNIQAPSSEASTAYKGYKTIFNNDLTTTSFNFIIPIYKNMPKTVSRYPSSSTYVSQYAQLNDAAHIRKTPAGDSMGVKNAGYSFLRIELKAANAGGHIWDKVMLQDGTIGYIATQYIVEKMVEDEVSKKAYINTNADLLNGPRTTTNGTTAIRTLYTYQPVTIIEQGKYNFDGFTWYRIKLLDGTVGYIQSNYVTEGSYGEEVRVYHPLGSLALRSTPNGNIIKYLDSGTIVTRIESAKEKVGAYYWDKVITSDGIVGYMAREQDNPYVQYLIPVNSNEKLKLNETDKSVRTIPGATFSDIKEKYAGATLVSGTENLGTGTVIKIDGVDYTIVKLGDVNGDAEIDVIDLALLKRHLMNTSHLQNEYAKAGMLQSDKQTEIDVIDLALLKRHLMNTQYINLT